MNKTVIGVGITVLAIIIAGAVVLIGRPDGNPATQDHAAHEHATKQSNLDTSTDKVNESTAGEEAVAANVVDIKDYAYAPATIKVKKGTTVTWTNQDSVKHDITPDQPSENFKGSELLGEGETYTFTFTEVGTYTYHCSPHPYMKGTVEVTE